MGGEIYIIKISASKIEDMFPLDYEELFNNVDYELIGCDKCHEYYVIGDRDGIAEDEITNNIKEIIDTIDKKYIQKYKNNLLDKREKLEHKILKSNKKKLKKDEEREKKYNIECLEEINEDLKNINIKSNEFCNFVFNEILE